MRKFLFFAVSFFVTLTLSAQDISKVSHYVFEVQATIRDSSANYKPVEVFELEILRSDLDAVLACQNKQAEKIYKGVVLGSKTVPAPKKQGSRYYFKAAYEGLETELELLHWRGDMIQVNLIFRQDRKCKKAAKK